MIKNIIILFLLLCGTAHAWEPTNDGWKYHDSKREWMWYNTVAEAACEIAIYADWRTTREFTGDRNKYPNMYEQNQYIGPHPSARRVNLYAGLYMVVHPVISWALPTPWREGWQAGTFYLNFSAAKHNHDSGITLNWKF